MTVSHHYISNDSISCNLLHFLISEGEYGWRNRMDLPHPLIGSQVTVGWLGSCAINLVLAKSAGVEIMGQNPKKNRWAVPSTKSVWSTLDGAVYPTVRLNELCHPLSRRCNPQKIVFLDFQFFDPPLFLMFKRWFHCHHHTSNAGNMFDPSFWFFAFWGSWWRGLSPCWPAVL